MKSRLVLVKPPAFNIASKRYAFARTLLSCACLSAAEVIDLAEGTVPICRRHLELIYDALQYHHAIRGDWPKQLSDLAGKYLAPEVLICPECEARGVYRMRDGGLRNPSESESQTIYKWELSLDQKIEPGSTKTWRDLKFRQRESAVGEAVPIVRCDQHDKDGKPIHLNLTFGGDVFVSGASWEEEFCEILPTPYLLPERYIFADVRPIAERVPKRPPGATVRQIDLKAVANALPGDEWQDGRSKDTFDGLLAKRNDDGMFIDRGVAFDVRALVQLDGRRKQSGSEEIGREEFFYPHAPLRIDTKVRGRRLHLLGGVVFPAPLWAEIGGVRITFASGRMQTASWIYGRDVRDGWHDPTVGDEHDKLVWAGEPSVYLPRSLPKRIGRLKVYHLITDLQESDITSLQFYSSASNPDPKKQYPAGPFLLAATVE